MSSSGAPAVSGSQQPWGSDRHGQQSDHLVASVPLLGSYEKAAQDGSMGISVALSR
jgi:hypothetical protein